MQLRTNFLNYIIFFLVFFLVASGVVITYKNYEEFKIVKEQQINKSYNDKEATVKEKLNTKDFILELLTFNPYIENVISEEPDELINQKIHNYLNNIKKIADFLAIFLLDEKGNCLLSTDKRFEGKNYGFRPYFKQAISNGTGTYVALGVTSKRLGLYIAKRLRSYFGRYGVLVGKIDPYSFIRKLKIEEFNDGYQVWGVTKSGVLFSPDKKGFFLLEKNSQKQEERVKKDRQFENVDFISLGFPKGTWKKLLKNKKCCLTISNKKIYLRLVPLIPDSFYLLTIIKDSFTPASLFMVKKALFITSSAFLWALLLLIFMMFLLHRQYETLEKERLEKDKSQERYRILIQNNKNAFLILDPYTLKIKEANEKFYQMLGIDNCQPEKVINKSIMDFITGENKRDIEIKLKNLSQSSGIEIRAELLDKDGIIIPVILDIGISKKSNQIFLYAFIYDLRKGLKDAQKIKLLETAVEQGGSSVIITDKNGKILYVNSTFCKVSGYNKEEVLGKSPKILSSNYHDAKFYEEMWNTISSGKVWHNRICNRKKDGRLYWEDVTIAPVFDENSNITHFVSIHNDITALVELEEKLNQKVQELESIMEYAGVGIALIQNRMFISINSTLAKLMNLSKDKVIGASTRILFDSDEEYQSFGNFFYPKLMKGEVVSYELEKNLPNGEKRWFQITATAINPGNVGQMKTVWVGNDITKLKKLQIDLEEAKKRAEEASKAKSAFLANMSHEIRTPLNGVIGMLGLLASTELNEEQKKYIRIAHSSAEALMFLINDILDISKIEAGKLEFDYVNFNLYSMLEDFVGSFGLSAQQKGLNFKWSFDKKLPKCFKGDPGRLRQVLINLAGNALKFTESGEIKIIIELIKDLGNRVLIKFSVVDTGIGIPKEKLKYLFKKFSQVDASISRKFSGTGLGLVISKSLVEMMGGEIGVESKEGVGSTFWFTVNLEKGDPKSDGCIESEAKYELFNKNNKKIKGRILIVEDNPVNQQVIIGILNNLGLRAEAVNNGKEAVEVLEIIPYDLVLMDVQMPIMDGITATELIRSPESQVLDPKIPIIALTAHAFRQEIERCLNAGMNDYITKPIEVNKLINILEKWLKSVQYETNFIEEENNINEKEQNNNISNANSVKSEKNIDKKDVVNQLEQEKPPIFDEEDFNRRIMNDLELAKQILALFFNNCKELFKELNKELENTNKENFVRVAHTIKGSASNIGAKRLAAIAYEIEKLGSIENFEDAKYKIKLLEKEYELLKKHERILAIFSDSEI